MAEPTGLPALMGEVIDEAGTPTIQPSLFPAAEVGALAGSPVLRDAHALGQALRKRGPGRPAGSLNKRNVAFRDYVLARAQGQHPVDGLIEAYSRPVAILAAELGCTLLEALRLQLDARRIVLEYVEGKMPVSVNVSGQAGIAVIFEGFAGAAGAAAEGEFFQPLSIEQPPDINGEVSNGET